MSGQDPILSVAGLRIRFRQDGRIIEAVRGIDFEIAPGETLAIVGESGSGKSVTALASAGLLPDSAEVTGSVRLRGREVVGAGAAALRAIRGRAIGVVFQEPMTSR
ncbi:MAG: ATP-binding cassette domain-containing protein, partial [Gemmobacter sp.]